MPPRRSSRKTTSNSKKASSKKRASSKKSQRNTRGSSKKKKQNDANASASVWTRLQNNDTFMLIALTTGIYTCFVYQGVLAESLNKATHFRDGFEVPPNHHVTEAMTAEHGPGMRYNFKFFSVFAQCVMKTVLAYALCLLFKHEATSTPTRKYVQIAFTYVSAMFASEYALNYVSYPTRILGKSCKLIPVMVMQGFILKKSFSWLKYAAVLTITAGICVFMLFKPTTHSVSMTADNAGEWVGIGLLLLSLTLDGFTGPTQDQVKRDHNPSVYRMMLNINLYAVLGLLVILLASGEMQQAWLFLQEYPTVRDDLLVSSLLGALGQWFLLLCIFRFDSLTLTTITTTRKFFTIITNVFVYHHVVSPLQWVGVVCVFGGLAMDMLDKQREKKKKEKKTA